MPHLRTPYLEALHWRSTALVAVLAAIVIAGCGGSSTSPGATTLTGTDSSTSGSTALTAYFTSPVICADNQGPDCTKLRLGNSFLSTTAPAVGRLYSCVAKNPNAPGSITSRITWIDNASGTWNLLRKPFLPASSANVALGTITTTTNATTRTIQSNNLPADGKHGDWPMTKYAVLTAIDPNPGTPAAQSKNFTLPLQPTSAANPACVSLGAIGVSLNGVVLFSAVDGRGDDAVANEIVDVYGGHPAMTEYHYHYVPERLDTARLSDGHSGIVGYIRDGFALYGYRGVGGVELSNADLDLCHGHSHGTLGYHYHSTMEYPYMIGCYRGTPQ